MTRTLRILRLNEPARDIAMVDDRAAREAEQQSWRVMFFVVVVFPIVVGVCWAVIEHLNYEANEPTSLEINCHRVHGARVCEGP